jgi:hypothetical protein
MISLPRNALSASGLIKPCVSEISPIILVMARIKHISAHTSSVSRRDARNPMEDLAFAACG